MTSKGFPCNFFVIPLDTKRDTPSRGRLNIQLSMRRPLRYTPTRFGGSARESNPPAPYTRRNGVEVRKGHRAPSTPIAWLNAFN